MNLGIYLKNLQNQNETHIAADILHHAISSNVAKDGSIFFDGVGPMPTSLTCGVFNSADLWNFSGKLIVFSLDVAHSAIKIVNNFDIIYYAGFEQINTLSLLSLMDKITVISVNEEVDREVYRLTNKKPIGVATKADELLELLS